MLNQVPAGRLYVERGAAAIRLIDVSILGPQRGRGIGTRLLQALQAEAAARQVPLQLSVVRGNPATRLYARLGFAEYMADEVYRHLEWRAAAAVSG